MRSLIALAALALSACQQQAPEPAAATRAPAPGIVSDFSQPMIARGNEPFWAVRIDGTRFTLMRPGEAEVVFEAPGASIVPGRAAWVARSADGREMRLTLYVSECSDGMSDQRYPMTAEVQLTGSETLRGCAAKTADLPRAGGG